MKRLLFTVSALIIACCLIVSCTKKNEVELAGNTPPPPCDTVNMKYSTDVVAILTANCYSCHAGNNPSSGIHLDSYVALKLYAGNGTLKGVINHDPGYPAMPEGGAKLSDCDINKIQSWINNGMQNN